MMMTGENRRIRGKACPGATLSTTNPTWTDPGADPSLRGERPATNRLSHGTAKPNFSIAVILCDPGNCCSSPNVFFCIIR
jgi:hypothetical protein